MPRLSLIHDNHAPRHAREELRAGVTGTDVEMRGLTVRAGDLPLFRSRGSHGLEQCVRVVVTAAHDMVRVRVGLRDGERVVDAYAGDVCAGVQRIELFVPEVDRERTFGLFVEIDGELIYEGPLVVEPQRKWSVHLVHHSHLDIGYTDPQGQVLRHHLTYLDSALDLVRETDCWDADAQFRWNIEANLSLQQWMRSRPRETVAEFVEHIRQGRFEVSAMPYNVHSDLCTLDELHRLLGFARMFRESYGHPLRVAMQTDVPGASMALATALAGEGVRYLSAAHNYAGRSVPFLLGGQQLPRAFRWRVPSGAELVVWYTDTPHGMAYMEGNILRLDETEEAVRELVPEYLQALSTRSYPYGQQIFAWNDAPPEFQVTRAPYPFDVLHMRVQGAEADNAAPNLATAEVVRDWNQRWAFPRLHMSTNEMFFTELEGRHGEALETFTGDWGNWWADGVGASARMLSFNRRALQTVRRAQTLHALAEATGASTIDDLDHRIGDVYDRISLFNEHTWGAANPWQDDLDKLGSGGLQWTTKAAYAIDALDQATALREAAERRLAHSLAAGGSAGGASGASVVVVNTDSTPRTDLVRVFVPFSRVGEVHNLGITDRRTGTACPSIVQAQEHERWRPTGRYVVFVAGNVPATGYAVFDIGGSPSDEASEVSVGASDVGAAAARIANEAFALEAHDVHAHAWSLRDRVGRRELINQDSSFGFGQFVLDRYGLASGFNHLSGRLQAHDVSLLAERVLASDARIVARQSNACYQSLTVRSNATGLDRLETTFRLVSGVPRLDISQRISKIDRRDKESGFFAFPFALHAPAVSYEVAGGVVRSNDDLVPGAPRHTRSIGRWVALEDSVTRVVWACRDTPLVHIGQLPLPYAPYPETLDDPEPATLFSWAFNNVWDTNFPSHQGGEAIFDYAVAVGPRGGAGIDLTTGQAVTGGLAGVLADREIPDAAGPSMQLVDVDESAVEVVGILPAAGDVPPRLALQSIAPAETVCVVGPGLFRPVGVASPDGTSAVRLSGGRTGVRLRPGELVLVPLQTPRIA